MQIGDINVTNSILNLENQLSILQQTLTFIMEHNKETLKFPNIKVMEEFQVKAFQQLQKKYPNMGIVKHN